MAHPAAGKFGNTRGVFPSNPDTVRVLTSDEAPRPRRAANEIIPQLRGYRGAEVPLQIAQTSPKLIKLGVITLRLEN